MPWPEIKSWNWHWMIMKQNLHPCISALRLTTPHRHTRFEISALTFPPFSLPSVKPPRSYGSAKHQKDTKFSKQPQRKTNALELFLQGGLGSHCGWEGLPRETLRSIALSARIFLLVLRGPVVRGWCPSFAFWQSLRCPMWYNTMSSFCNSSR